VALPDGTVVSHQEYDAFGCLIVATGSQPCPFGFSTKYTDAETGLVSYGYRFHAPELGRWVSRDPIGEVAGQSLFAFAGNDPCALFDPLGLWAMAAVHGCTGEKTRQIKEGFDVLRQKLDAITQDATERNRYKCCIQSVHRQWGRGSDRQSHAKWGPNCMSGLSKLRAWSSEEFTSKPLIRCGGELRKRIRVPVFDTVRRTVRDSRGVAVEIEIKVPRIDPETKEVVYEEAEMRFAGSMETATLNLYTDAFSDGFGPLQCTLLHELVHALGEDKELITSLAAVFCFEKEWKCRGYGIDTFQNWGL